MSRRNQIGMTDMEITAFLNDSRTMTLVSNGKDGYPHPMPMWFAVDEDGIVNMSTFRKSQKVSNLKKDNKVSLLVESGDKYQELKGIVIYSQVEIIDDLDTTTEVMSQVALQRGDITAEQEEAAMKGMSSSAAKRVTLRFVPERIVSWDHSKLGGVY